MTIAFGATAAEGTGAEREPRPVDGMISFEGGNRRLTARLIGGEFIRYRSRFPAEFGSRAVLPAAVFTEAVRRVSLVADRATPVRLAFDAGSVVIEAQTDGRARAVETVPAEFEGGERVISFSPHYLLDGLVAAGGVRPGPAARRAPRGRGREAAGRPRPDPARVHHRGQARADHLGGRRGAGPRGAAGHARVPLPRGPAAGPGPGVSPVRPSRASCAGNRPRASSAWSSRRVGPVAGLTVLTPV